MYDEIYDSWKKEKTNSYLGELNRDFYSRLIDFLKKIEAELKVLDEDSIGFSLMLRELKLINKLVKDLIQVRYQKRIRQTFGQEILPTDVLSDEEREIQETIIRLFKSYQSLQSDSIKKQTGFSDKASEKKYLLVRFLSSIPAIAGSDMKTYGPFKQEDVATLPLRNANILISRGVAVKIESE